MFGCATCKGSMKSNEVIAPSLPILERANELYHSDTYSLVIYQGASYPHPVGSPTGVIAKDKFATYGVAQKGHYLLVHNEDIAKRPDIFVKLEIGSDDFNQAIKLLSIDVNYTPVQAITAEEAVPVVEETETGDLAVIEEQEESIITDKIEVNGEIVDYIDKEHALPLKKFRDKFKYTHHLRVLADVRAGVLESEKRGKTVYVWHKTV